MRILALETSTDWCSVAVGDGVRWCRRDERAGQAHSERLLPMIDAALAEAGWSLSDLDGLAFGAGSRFVHRNSYRMRRRPGPRVGRRGCLSFRFRHSPRSRRRRFAPTAGRACLPASTRGCARSTRPAYARHADGWREVAAPVVVAPGDLAGPASSAEESWAGAGNGFAAYPGLASRLALIDVDPSIHPTAQAIGELALPRLAAGEGVPAEQALPVYVRHRVALTTAEREAGIRL